MSRDKMSQMLLLLIYIWYTYTRSIHLIPLDTFDRYTWCTWYCLIHSIHFVTHLKHLNTHNTSCYTWFFLIHLIPLGLDTLKGFTYKFDKLDTPLITCHVSLVHSTHLIRLIHSMYCVPIHLIFFTLIHLID